MQSIVGERCAVGSIPVGRERKALLIPSGQQVMGRLGGLCF